MKKNKKIVKRHRRILYNKKKQPYIIFNDKQILLKWKNKTLVKNILQKYYKKTKRKVNKKPIQTKKIINEYISEQYKNITPEQQVQEIKINPNIKWDQNLKDL